MMEIPLTLKDDRIIGWIKHDLLTKDELEFCIKVYGESWLSQGQWAELSRINKRNDKKLKEMVL